MVRTNNAALWDGHNADWWQNQLDVPAVYLYETIASTNDEARRLADHGAQTMTLVIADQQTAGRGRAGRSWASTSGSSLLFSIIFLTEPDPAATAGAAPVRIGSAVAKAIEYVSGVPALLKWPNDVILTGQGKVAGILCEAAMRQQGATHVIAGIGVNVSHPGSDYGSINEVAKRQVSRGDVLRRVVATLKPFARQITTPLSDAELSDISKRDILFGQQVESDNQLVGKAAGIASDGSLRLETVDGMRSVYSATIRMADTKAYPGTRT